MFHHVAKKKQLRIAAQRREVYDFAARHKFKIVAEFIERKSGLSRNRPVLDECLAECKRLNATLLISKVDRLFRRLLFTMADVIQNVQKPTPIKILLPLVLMKVW